MPSKFSWKKAPSKRKYPRRRAPLESRAKLNTTAAHEPLESQSSTSTPTSSDSPLLHDNLPPSDHDEQLRNEMQGFRDDNERLKSEVRRLSEALNNSRISFEALEKTL